METRLKDKLVFKCGNAFKDVSWFLSKVFHWEIKTYLNLDIIILTKLNMVSNGITRLATLQGLLVHQRTVNILPKSNGENKYEEWAGRKCKTGYKISI